MNRLMFRSVCLLVIVLSSFAFVFAQAEDDVVINEANINSTTQKEFIELRVTNPAGVNMQGWTVSDVSTRAGATSTTEGDITLPAAASYLANVPAGTLVVIVLSTPSGNNNTLTEDTSTADGNNRLVILPTTTGVVAGGTLDLSTNENIQLYAVGGRAVGTLIDQVLMGNNTSLIAGATWGDNDTSTITDNINAGTSIPSGADVAFMPANSTLAEIQNNDTGSRFTVTNSSYGTPGLSNTTTASNLSISGRAMTADGRGITNAVVTLSGGTLQAPISFLTGRRGMFNFADLDGGDTYVVSIEARRFVFEQPNIVINLDDSVTNANFVAAGSGGAMLVTRSRTSARRGN